ncbi:MAG: putative glycine dehydrogenase (decarboxylating) subunit 1 [Pirellulaceae bacterium]|nr:MAG: putative glycine dehydrogenase (decarboxylating) subunit 1 [Pirellulaceae bacterium]
MAYLFNTEEDVREMLAAIGEASIEALFASIPSSMRLNRPLAIPPGMSEIELQRHLQSLARRNTSPSQAVCFLGGGAYDHFIPAVVDHLAMRGEFYTSYTPYQPEVSQGNLQVMFEYETMICQLTGMDVSNASLYDGATAMVEAVLLAMAGNASDKKVIVVPESIHPDYRHTLETYLRFTEYQLRTVPCPAGMVDQAAWEQAIDESAGCVVVGLPSFFGTVEDQRPLVAAAKAAQAHVIAVADMIGLGLFAPPAQWGADIVVAEGQPLGNPLQFGGPYLGILACTDAFLRRMPGRIAGQTTDRDGNRCWVLTLQTREQHIRREKATSNICTNQGLLALRATIYLALLGPAGLRETAEQCSWKTQYLIERLVARERFELAFPGPYWREVTIRDRHADVAGLVAHARQQGMLAGVPLGQWYPAWNDCLLIAVTEKRTREEIDRLVDVLASAPSAKETLHA